MKISSFLLVVYLFTACNKESSRMVELDSKIQIKYATGFIIDEGDSFTKVTVSSPFQGAQNGFSYFLVPKNATVPEILLNKSVIRTPIKSIVCTSTTHLPILEYLDEDGALKGFPDTDYISSIKIRERIENGDVVDIGKEQGMNIELLLSLAPELVMGYMVSPDMGQLDQISKLGIPVVINAEYREAHPLGRAEWIKFVAVFFDKLDLADSVFSEIESSYNDALLLAQSAKSKPTVFSGVVYGDTWFLPGGRNYASSIIQDAGGQYLWNDDTTSGFLELGFESVYEKAVDADYWIGTASYSSLEALSKADVRYEMFDAFKNKKVFTYNKRIGEKGGNEYLELGYLRPDLILNDLVMILHPEFYDPDELFFFMPLE